MTSLQWLAREHHILTEWIAAKRRARAAARAMSASAIRAELKRWREGQR